MNRSRRRALPRLVAAAALVLITAGVNLGDTFVANADTVGGAISGNAYSSDPEIFTCPNSHGSADATLCIYTSNDVGSGSNTSNYYPMNKTYLYRLNDGADAAIPANWVGTPILDEQQDVCGQSATACGANHLWAPGGRRYNNSQYLLYVPDITDVNAMDTSSIIMAYSSTSQLGTSGYNFLGVVNTPASPNGGYASDPFFYSDSVAPPNNYLVWANGDFNNCGGLSIGKFAGASFTTLASGGPVSIQNWSDNMGTCGGTGHPYLEGAALYRSAAIGSGGNPAYTLIFAAKPGAGAPTGCNSDNEVIAYAQSNSVLGPYDYKGIVMCGSEGPDGGEWTNQASVVRSPMTGKYVFAYHDGPHANGTNAHSPRRKVHLQCLRFINGTIARIPRSSTNLSNC
jgi:hypothetical protein